MDYELSVGTEAVSTVRITLDQNLNGEVKIVAHLKSEITRN